MSINLIIISRYSNTNFYNQVAGYFSTLTPIKVEPTDTNYESKLVANAIDTTKYNLIIYDWSSTLTSDLTGILTSLTDGTPTYDVTYLGKFQDTCNKYSAYETVSTSAGPVTLVTGTDPVGFNAALLTPTFSANLKPYLLANNFYTVSYGISSYKTENTVKEFALSPNVFTYNPLYNSIDLSQSFAVKSEECQLTTSQIEPPTDNDLNLFWVLLIIIGIALLIFILIKVFKVGSTVPQKSNTSDFVPIVKSQPGN